MVGAGVSRQCEPVVFRVASGPFFFKGQKYVKMRDEPVKSTFFEILNMIKTHSHASQTRKSFYSIYKL